MRILFPGIDRRRVLPACKDKLTREQRMKIVHPEVSLGAVAVVHRRRFPPEWLLAIDLADCIGNLCRHHTANPGTTGRTRIVQVKM